MSALSDYVAAVIDDHDLLEWASARDSAAIWIIDGESRYEHECRLKIELKLYGKNRRTWTRQDVRRRQYELECQEISEEIDSAGEVVTDELRCKTPAITGRMSTRVERCLRRWSMPDHRTALSEAKLEGTYPLLAPLIVALSEAHRKLRRLYAGQDYDETWDGHRAGNLSWAEVAADHHRAIEEIMPHVVDSDSTRGDTAEVTLAGAVDDESVIAAEDLSAEFRDGGVASGEPLVFPYLAEAVDWQLTPGQLAGARRRGAVPSVKVRIDRKVKDAHKWEALSAFKRKQEQRICDDENDGH